MYVSFFAFSDSLPGLVLLKAGQSLSPSACCSGWVSLLSEARDDDPVAPGMRGPQRVQAREAISQSAPLVAEVSPVQMQMKPLPWTPESQPLLKEQHQRKPLI